MNLRETKTGYSACLTVTDARNYHLPQVALLSMVAIFIFNGQSSAAPGFDCSIAAAPIEKIICSDDELSNLDSALGHLYHAKRLSLKADHAHSLLDEQRRWLARRADICKIPSANEQLSAEQNSSVIECLDTLYRDRLVKLDMSAALPEELAERRDILDHLHNYINTLYALHDNDRKLLARKNAIISHHIEGKDVVFVHENEAAYRHAISASREDRLILKNSVAAFASIARLSPYTPNSFRYALVMSENDQLCRPLTDIYNRLLAKLVPKAALAPRWPKESWEIAAANLTDFEVAYPGEFTNIGEIREGLDELDVLGTGAARTVYLSDNVPRGGAERGPATTVLIMKDGVDKQQVQDRVEAGESLDPIVDTNIGLKRERTGSDETGDLGHFLRKWPHFNDIVDKLSDNGIDIIGYVPVLTGRNTDRILVFRHDVYFIRNNYIDARFMRDVYDQMNIVLVYRLTPTGSEDVCYIASTPSHITDITEVFNHD